MAISRKISLPASAHECAASATSDADPVSAAAADLATAISTFAPRATRTVVKLSDSPGPPSDGNDLSGPGDPGAVPSAVAGAGASSLPRSRAINQY